MTGLSKWIMLPLSGAAIALTPQARAKAQSPPRWSPLLEVGIGRVWYGSEWFRSGAWSSTASTSLSLGVTRSLRRSLGVRASLDAHRTASGIAVPLCAPDNLPDPGFCDSYATAPGTLVGGTVGLWMAPARGAVRLGIGAGMLVAPEVEPAQADSWTGEASVELRLARMGRAALHAGVRGARIFTPLAGARYHVGPTVALSF